MLTVKNSAVVSWSQGKTALRAGQTIASDHPLAVERPELFEEREPTPDITWKPNVTVIDEPPIERGTRAPGEVREGVRRPGRPRKVVAE